MTHTYSSWQSPVASQTCQWRTGAVLGRAPQLLVQRLVLRAVLLTAA